MYDKFAPIIPFVGMGGIRLNMTKQEVERLLGRRLEQNTTRADDAWVRYEVEDIMTLFFTESGDRLVAMETLPGYRGTLPSGIGTDTDEQLLFVLDPSLEYDEFEEFYSSGESGIQIETNLPEHKAVWILIHVPELNALKG